MAPTTDATTTSAPPEVTWRDALTPLSRSSRRRWTACYALLLIFAAASVVGDTFAVDANGNGEGIPILLVVALLIVFGMLRRGTRRIAALDHPDLDERDIAARNSAYRIAFPLLGLVVLAGLFLVALAAPDVHHRAGNEDLSGSFLDLRALIGLGVWVGLWAIFLPTGVLAWREPDALESETGGGLAESMRDALLALALAGGMAVDLLTNHNGGEFVFVAGVALLGGLSRRASGQPMMSRQRKWRVAIGLGMIAIIVAWLIIANAGGGG